MNRLHFVLVITIFAGIKDFANSKFPNDPKPCKYEDSECIAKIMNYLFHEKSTGYSSLNLVPIDPLPISEISIKQGAESAVNIDLTFIKNSMTGLSTATTYKVKGFGKDLTKKHEFRTKVKVISLVGDYTINGKILILPISGAGKSNITIVNGDVKMAFSGTKVEKDGATYMKVNDLRIEVKPERLYYNFGNLFNGDKALGDNMNLFLNENWKEIYNEVEVSIASAFAKVFQSVINKVFEKIPYEKYFAE